MTGKLTSATTVDMDLELYNSAGSLLARSGSDTPNETVTAAIRAGSNYFYRVIGWAGVAQDWKIESIQSALVLKAGTSGGGGGGTFMPPATGTLTKLLRFTVNPVLKTVSVKVVG